MLRRVLPVAAAAAALVAIPSTAFATAPQAPVENMFAASYLGYADLVLPDGRDAIAILSEYRGASQNGWSGDLTLYVTAGASCADASSCGLVDASGTATLTEGQVAFSRNLDRASAVDVPMTLTTSPWSPDEPATVEQVTVSVVFSGTGPVTRDASHQDTCGDGFRVCQSHRVSADRGATVALAVGGQSTSGPGHLSYGLGTDTAAPKFGPQGP